MLERLDHLVLTTAQPEVCVQFYTAVLGMRLEMFGAGRMALRYGDQKINIHVIGQHYQPKAHAPAAGTLDLCFIAAVPLETVIARLKEFNIEIIAGPGPRSGALGTIQSVYIRDPDLNLIEISVYQQRFIVNLT
jgi:catechol 2,3-dioxygenase-like lactoylglutathione lyase family enzyme